MSAKRRGRRRYVIRRGPSRPAAPAAAGPAGEPAAPVEPAALPVPSAAATEPSTTVATAVRVVPVEVTAAVETPVPVETAPPVETALSHEELEQRAWERHRRTMRELIEDAAYYIAEKRGFAEGDPDEDWREAERQVRELLGRSHG